MCCFRQEHLLLEVICCVACMCETYRRETPCFLFQTSANIASYVSFWHWPRHLSATGCLSDESDDLERRDAFQTCRTFSWTERLACMVCSAFSAAKGRLKTRPVCQWLEKPCQIWIASRDECDKTIIINFSFGPLINTVRKPMMTKCLPVGFL